jgi:hypothetical protein
VQSFGCQAALPTAQESSQDFQYLAHRILGFCNSGQKKYCSLKVQDEPESNVVVAIRRRVVVAVGHSAVRCIVVPIAAADNATRDRLDPFEISTAG